MRYVFFGSPEFASIILKRLIDGGYPPIAVITNPDRPQGRKHALTPPPAKVVARENNITVLQPEKLSADVFNDFKDCDLFLVAAYSKIIPEDIISMPRLGTIGVHPSLLPKFRGASPIQYTILAGEKETGTTLFLIDEKVDHGPIFAQKGGVSVDDKYFNDLTKELADVSAGLLLETLRDIVDGKITPLPQNEAEVTLTKKIKTDDGFVSEEELVSAQSGTSFELAKKINRMIHAFNPDPGVYTIKDGKRMKILKSSIKNGSLRLEIVQWEGKKPVSI